MTRFAVDALERSALENLHFSLAGKQLLDGVSDAIVTLTYPELKVVYANERAKVFFEGTHGIKDLFGQHLSQFTIDAASQRWNAFIAEAVEHGIYETDYVGVTENRVWKLRFESLLLEDRCVGISVIAQDTTQLARFKRQVSETESLYLSLFEAMSVGAVFQGNDGRIIGVNRAAEVILGRTAAEVMGLTSEAPDWDPIREDGSPFPGKEHPSMITLRTGAPQSDVSMGIRRADGARRWLLVSSQPIFMGRERELKAVVGTFHDVTEKREMREQLKAKVAELDQALIQMSAAEANRRREQVRFRSAVQAAPTAMIMVDRDGTIILANDRADTMFGFGKGTLVGNSLNVLLPSGVGGSHESLLHKFMQDPEERPMGGHRAIHARDKEGREFRVEIGLTPITDEAGQFVLASITDLRAQLDAQQRIERLTNFDPLTGLPNRSYLRTYVTNALAEVAPKGRSFAILVLDLDNFKYVNDTLSHLAGDKLLMGVAKRLVALEISGGSAARIGGDEFVLMLPYRNEADLIRQASLVQSELARPHLIDGTEVIVPVSTGIALSPSDGTSFDTLIQNAETAMHRAKEEGRNSFRFFAKDMQVRTRRLLALETGLHTALERQQFRLCYQPQFDACGDRMIGVEALIRWQHPELGAVPPAEFIPLAERNGQIVQIGTWVLQTAISQMKLWNDAGLGPLSMAVNLSAVQFRQHDLPSQVARILHLTGLPPEQLELELTETAAMADPLAAMAMTRELSSLGVKIAIDDFGAGYSSLTYLNKFVIHKLKIDQSFINDIERNAEDRAVVRSIIHLGRDLGLKTIAEGVETSVQFDFLRAEGCDGFQGYYFAKPLTADDILHRLSKQKEA